MSDNTGGPAFPSKREHTTKEGMTLRDYFAAKVLPSLYLDYVNEQRMEGERIKIGSPHDPGVSAECLAQECYAIADAMLAARNYKDD
jgi:hypothetical protein